MLLERVWDYGVEGDDLCCPLFVFESCLERGGIYCSERRFVVEISLDIFAYLILNRSVFSFRREEFLFNIKVINIFCTHDNFIRDSLLLLFLERLLNERKQMFVSFRDSKVIYFEIQLNIFIYQRDWDISIRIEFHLKNTRTRKYIIFTTCQNE